jgi:hypothetical protein
MGIRDQGESADVIQWGHGGTRVGSQVEFGPRHLNLQLVGMERNTWPNGRSLDHTVWDYRLTVENILQSYT